MLEILILVRFCKKLAAMARAKNRPGSWGALGAILWIVGEISGAVIGASAGANGMAPYGFALVGAVVGAVIAYVIVSSLSDVPPETNLPIARIV